MIGAMLTLQEAHALLKEAHYNYLRPKSTMSDVDLRCIPKNKPRKLSSTNGITAAIVDYLTYTGVFATRISSAGRVIKKDGKQLYIKSNTKKGIADISAIYQGLSISIEVKNEKTKDTIKPDQLKVKQQIEQSGGIYYIATSFNGWLSWWLNDITNKIPCRA